MWRAGEKAPVQVLNRQQPVAGTPRHDHLRHGTTRWLAALNLQSGAIERSLRRHHGSQESKAFLDQLDAAIPADLAVPLVLDNWATHKAPPMHRWLVKHPRVRMHFAPARASWRNFVERWAAELAPKKLQRTARRRVKIWPPASGTRSRPGTIIGAPMCG